ncbi:sugar phosphate nucleotidyltransferase [Paenibacillus elgii]|uniref:sugar phosphate nucleotidyltransferase n=1 Tax=Paenibacillus elgii TaxID=189691 RepID=UPI0030DD84FA
MKLILLSGGSGKRLWPLSNDSRSKQFLKVLEAEDGSMESMVQRVWRQLTLCSMDKDSYIATSKSQVDILQNQLGQEIPLIIEPSRMDTFPAIVLASSYLHSIKKIDPNEVVIVLPVDPYVEQTFYLKLYDLEKSLLKSNAQLALLGVRPTFASEKYGYIVPNYSNDNHDFYSVREFKEKPTIQQANKLIEQNALWNCGVFAFKLDFLLSLMKKKMIPTDFQEVIDRYSELPKISFDYEVVEKESNVIVVPYDGGWKDLGTWNTLTEEMAKSKIGNVIMENCENSHVINELDTPTLVLGMSDVIIVNSSDGILVADKKLSPKLKDLLPKNSEMIMYEEKKWGMSRVLDCRKLEEKEVITKRVVLKENCNLSLHYHNHRIEIWTFLSGNCEIMMDGNKFTVSAGDTIRINPGVEHSIKAITETEFIEIQAGTNLSDNDTIRITFSWD